MTSDATSDILHLIEFAECVCTTYKYNSRFDDLIDANWGTVTQMLYECKRWRWRMMIMLWSLSHTTWCFWSSSQSKRLPKWIKSVTALHIKHWNSMGKKKLQCELKMMNELNVSIEWYVLRTCIHLMLICLITPHLLPPSSQSEGSFGLVS